ARALGVPCFWEMPNVLGDRYPFGLNRRIYQRQCRRFGVVPLSNSAYTGASLGGPIRARVMHLGVDATRFDPDRVAPVTRAELGIPADAVVLSVVGRLEPQKGQDRVLRAMLTVGADAGAPPLHLLLLGGPTDGPFAAELRSIAAAAGAAGRLHLLGTRPDPERYYGATDVAVNARVDAEPYGLSVVEAMMMGRPVLAHALGGPAETVVDGTTGWHVGDPTAEALAAGLRRALADRPRWPRMRQAARAHALAHFTVERQAAFFTGVVNEVLAGRGK
ncbi:MAG TPA: glycosyltransferase family 4 protein, partial [Humisphaera sp.]